MTAPRDNSGTLARNTKKALDRHPDIRGQCVISGRAYRIAGWKRENKYGTFYSLAFTPKEPAPGTPPEPGHPASQTPPQSMSDVASPQIAMPPTEPPTPTPLREVLDDDIPF